MGERYTVAWGVCVAVLTGLFFTTKNEGFFHHKERKEHKGPGAVGVADSLARISLQATQFFVSFAFFVVKKRP